ncbi:unnamed protein product [Caenorhabditis brenneri]
MNLQPVELLKKTTYAMIETQHDLDRLSVVGEGAYGKVYQVQNKSNKVIYAMKVITIKPKEKHFLENEILILKTSKSPFICKMYQCFESVEKVYLVLEFIPGGDLHSFLDKTNVVNEDHAKFFLAEIFLALDYLHNNHIIYRDLKPENIMFDRRGHIKLTDFGLCKLNMYEGAKTKTICGTVEFMAPEVIKGYPYGFSVDIWSFGVLMYEMLTGEKPFSGTTDAELEKAIVSGKVTLPKILSRVAKELIKRLLTRATGNRFRIAEVKESTFFSATDWQKMLLQEIEPPIRPCILNDRDVSNFDEEFTTQMVTHSCGKSDTEETMTNSFENFDIQLS